MLTRRLWIAALLLLALAVAFWQLDFRAARSQTGMQSQVTTMGAGRGSASLPAQAGLAVYVVGESALARTTADELSRFLATNPVFGRVEIVGAMPQAMGRPALVVELEEPAVAWTPIYARAKLTVAAAYASDGDLSWRHQPTLSTGDNGPEFLLNGRLELSDVTWGIISRRAYHKALGQQVAAEVGKALASALATPAAEAPAAN